MVPAASPPGFASSTATCREHHRTGTRRHYARGVRGDDFDRLDLELHERLRSSDLDAFEEVYRRYAPGAYGLALRVTGQEMLAQEVVHDAFMALWRAPEAYDPARGPFRAFFLSLVHHRAVDMVRREERQRRLPERMNPEPLLDEDVAERVVDDAWLADRRARVVAALGE